MIMLPSTTNQLDYVTAVLLVIGLVKKGASSDDLPKLRKLR